jgi:hypothetical protein
MVADATAMAGSFSSSLMRHGPGIGVRLGFWTSRARAEEALAASVGEAEGLPATTARSSRGGTTWMSRAMMEVTVARPKMPPKTAVRRGER